MIALTLAQMADPDTGGLSLDLNGLISGGAGASLIALVIWVFKLILDRTIPSRSDARANVTIVLEGLSNMVKVLQDEKIADANRLADKQARIDVLEGSADKDFELIAELRKEILDLRHRLQTKERHIQILAHQLRLLGAQVAGIESDPEDELDQLEITMPTQARIPEHRPRIPEVDITQ